MVEKSRDDPESEALVTVAKNRLNVLERARAIHARKAWALVAAVAAEALAVGALAWAMLALLY